MKKWIFLASMLFATSASAVSMEFLEGEEIVTAREVVQLTAEVGHGKAEPMEITLQSRTGNPFNPNVIQFPQGDSVYVESGGKESIPLYLKMKDKGVYKVTLCAAEAPIEYLNKDGVSVKLVIRICDTIKITRR